MTIQELANEGLHCSTIEQTCSDQIRFPEEKLLKLRNLQYLSDHDAVASQFVRIAQCG